MFTIFYPGPVLTFGSRCPSPCVCVPVCLSWTWKDFIRQNVFCTKYNNSQSRLLIRQETLIKVHMHRLHKGHQRSKQVYHAVSLSSFSVFTCIKIWRWIRSHGTNDFFLKDISNLLDRWIMKQNLHAIADTIVKFSIDFFCGLDRFTCRIIHAEDNYCIWILHTESGIDYIVRELKRKKSI